jgi:hypothetical protein
MKQGKSHKVPDDEYAWLDQQLREDFAREEEDFLEDEMAKRIKDGLHYRFGCPYCSFQSDYFHSVTIHMVKSQRCADTHKVSPCYPILLYRPKGAPIP